ncbi:hypothetical protein KPSA1_05910 [Pseudomonas syringae pv. actinidiae]|uniref:Uncharacterized protein n=1 Tax=Pseudomonas syringae pv. actinidiae TaxID=103796 RepID=A0A2V0QHT0_PSESF|nr:hypothetical protein KPSA1_05910 [Pseudomonas syringae pv. actinidiae]
MPTLERSSGCCCRFPAVREQARSHISHTLRAFHRF